MSARAERPIPPEPEPLPGLFDTHAHLAEFAAEEESVLARARHAGLVGILAVGTDADDAQVVLDWARRHPDVFAAVGIHPNQAAKARPGDWERILALCGDPRVVAIGETGLDRYWNATPFPDQREWFERHLDLGARTGKAVVIHCRETEADLLDQLRARPGPTRGILHSFSGTIEHARGFLDWGLHVSFAGQVTFTNKALDALREVARFVPADRLLVETDSPYLTPHPHRGARNEPACVAWTLRRVAEARGVPPGALAEQVARNARDLFGIDASEDRSTG